MSARYRAAESVARVEKSRKQSAERRAPSIARGRRTPKGVPGGFAGRSRGSQPRRFPALRFPFWGR
jgi:hypothetical protein